MKMGVIRPQSLDRIEVTYNRYYKDSDFINLNLHEITNDICIKFLSDAVIKRGGMTAKEFSRLYQINNNVITYALDLEIGNAPLLNWEFIKRCIPRQYITDQKDREYSLRSCDIKKMAQAVVYDKVYYLKQSASLCIVLNFYLGLRIGELASLTWQDIDWHNQCLRICKTETKFYKRNENGEREETMSYGRYEPTKTVYSVREIPLVEDALVLLRELKKHHEKCRYASDFLAYDGVDSVLVRSIDRTLRKLCMLCGIDVFNSHLIRKAFASKLHDKNVPTRLISDLLGHSEITTTEHYYILSSRNGLDEVRQTMSDALTDIALSGKK